MAAGAAATPDRRPPSGAGVVSPSSATGATAAVTSQPLSAAQQAALRRLEAWVRDDDAAARPLPTDESATLLFTATERELANGHASEDAGVPGTEMPALMAHPAGSAPAGAVAAVRTAAELEALVLRAERQESVNALAADRAAIAWIGAQVEAATALADSVAAARAALAAERELCGAARRHATPVMEDFSATAAKREREAAAAAARAAQLRPIEDARAVAATLDAAAGGSGSSPHDSRHPLVRALATLDGSIEHIKASPSASPPVPPAVAPPHHVEPTGKRPPRPLPPPGAAAPTRSPSAPTPTTGRRHPMCVRWAWPVAPAPRAAPCPSLTPLRHSASPHSPPLRGRRPTRRLSLALLTWWSSAPSAVGRSAP